MLFYITVSVLVVSANAVVYTDCGSKLASVQKVSVSGCAEDAERCVLQRNINITFSIEFTPNEEVTEVETRVYALLSIYAVEFLQPHGPKACMDRGQTCPLPAGQKASLQTIARIENQYPQETLQVTWQLKNQNLEDLTCIMFTAEIE